MRPKTRGNGKKGKTAFKPPRPVTPAPAEENNESSEEEYDGFAEIGKHTADSSTKWTPEKEHKLCELWEGERHLYDTTARDYRNSRKRQEAFQRFATALEMDAKEIEVHLRTLRTSFTKISNQPSGSGYGRLTARQREIILMCKFLRCHIKNREGVCNLRQKRFIMTAAAAREARAKAAEANAAGSRDPSPSEYAPIMDDIMDDDSPATTPKPNGQQKRVRGRPAQKVRDNNNDDRRARSPQPGTSAANGDTDDEGNAGGDAEPPYAVRSAKKCKTAAETRTELVGIMHGRTGMFQRLTDAVANNAKPAQEAPVNRGSAIDMWGQITAHKVKGMSDRAGRHFMLRVDTMAAEELDDMDE